MSIFNRKVLIVLALLLLCLQMGFAGGSKEVALNNGTAGTGNVKKATSFAWITQNSEGDVEYGEPQTDEANAVPPINAIGVVYYNDKGGVELVSWFDSDEAWLAQWITYISDAINQVTFRVALAMHPFPNIMFSLYDLNAASQNGFIALNMIPKEKEMATFSLKDLLITNDYYVGGNTFKTIQGYELEKDVLPMAEKQDSSATGINSLQFHKWSIVTLLFLTCFVAEILFTAIFGYATGSSEEGGASLLKNIAKKIAITLVVFVLVSALPFLLESFRYGLFNVAYAFYGEAADNYNDILVKRGYTAPNIIDSKGTVTNMFELPGYFMQSMKDFFTKTGSSTIQDSISSAMTKSSGDKKMISVVIHSITWVIATIYRFFMFFMVLKAAIHIARNILEIYILLGLVMILTPFAVFTPTKTIGSKCIMSLVSNVVECFIILVIVLTVIPAVKAATVSIISNVSVLNRLGTYSWEVDYSIMETVSSGGTDTERKIGSSTVKFLTNTSGAIEICSIGTKSDKIAFLWQTDLSSSATEINDILLAEGVKFKVDISKVTDPSSMSMGDITVKQINGSSASAIRYDSSLNVLYVQEEGSADNKKKGYPILLENENYVNSMVYMFAKAVQESGLMTTSKESFNSSYNAKDVLQKIANYFKGLYVTNSSITGYMWQELEGLRTVTRPGASNNYGTVGDPYNVKDNETDVEDYKLKSTHNNAVAYAFMQFTLIFMGMFIPCFFVQQSTQITNALMNGSAGMESLANAMNDVLRRTMHGVGRIAGGIQSAGGNIFGGINRHNANQSSKAAASAAKTTAANTSTLLDLLNQNEKGQK